MLGMVLDPELRRACASRTILEESCGVIIITAGLLIGMGPKLPLLPIVWTVIPRACCSRKSFPGSVRPSPLSSNDRMSFASVGVSSVPPVISASWRCWSVYHCLSLPRQKLILANAVRPCDCAICSRVYANVIDLCSVVRCCAVLCGLVLRLLRIVAKQDDFSLASFLPSS